MPLFVIVPSAIASGGTPYQDTTPVGNYDGWASNNVPPITLLECFNASSGTKPSIATCGNAAAPSAFADTVRLSCSGATIYLEGSSTPISVDELPAGFKLTGAVLVFGGSPNPAFGGTAEWFLQFGSIIEGAADQPILEYDFSSNPPSMLTLVSNGCGVRVNLSAPTNDVSSISFGSFLFAGSYEINRLVRVSFSGGRDLRFDNNSADYVAPHWVNSEE